MPNGGRRAASAGRRARSAGRSAGRSAAALGRIAIVGIGIAAAACRGRDAAVAVASASTRDSTPAHAPGYVVDSALAPDEMLRRFRVGLDSVSRFDDRSAPSRDALVRQFTRALAARDTAALRAMSLTRAEFGYLYYPTTQYVRPPYLTSPDVLWRLMHARSESGMKRLVARVGGMDVRFAGYECEPTPVVEGRNRLLEPCRMRYRRGADSLETRRLFGSIIERDGRFKFVSYANDF